MSDPLARPRRGYIPTLDGWRALAVLGVLLSHQKPIRLGHLHLDSLTDIPSYGVQIFFAVSGILICTRLVDEESHRGSISFRNFYLRRLFRIQPAAFAYLLTLAVLALFAVIPFTAPAWWASVFSVRNLSVFPHAPPGALWYTGHFWSLAVEEHFYLFLPLLLLLTRGRFRLILFGLISLLAIAWTLHFKDVRGGRTDVELAWLIFPSFCALLLRRRRLLTLFERYFPAGPVLTLTLLGLALIVFRLHMSFIHIFLLATVPVAVLATIVHPTSWPGRALEWRPLKAIGRVSYSLYLWQELFNLKYANGADATLPFAHLQQLPWKLLAPIVLAFASYFLIEQPFIKLGHRLTTR